MKLLNLMDELDHKRWIIFKKIRGALMLCQQKQNENSFPFLALLLVHKME
jgi:hypothetical protein